MALDAIFLSGLIAELRPKLEGAKIDKVQQPEREQVILSVRNNGENMKLLINSGAGSGRLQLTGQSFENPSEPPMFCMLLRKYLIGGRIAGITQPDWERLVLVDIISRNELGDSIGLKLCVELMGRSSNLVLIGPDGRIIDCLRRMDFGGDAERRMLPGMIYRLPPKQKKPIIFDCTEPEIREKVSSFETGRALDKALLDSFSGLSPAVCRELAYRCGEDRELLPTAISALLDSVRSGELKPTLMLRDSKPEAFSFMHMSQYSSELRQCEYGSFCELLDAYYSKREQLEHRQRRSKELKHSVKTAYDRISRKLINQREELKKTENRDEIRKNAELLTANMYKVKKGMRSVTVEDYFTEGCPQVEIELNELKTPQQNAAAMFKEYNKLKTAELHLTELIAEGEKQLEYLGSVLCMIDNSESEQTLSDIYAELIGTGYIKKQKNAKPPKQKKQSFLRFESTDGFEILVGRSNSQNDELTTKLARRTDIWLHTKSVHGSHVIISCEGLEPTERTIFEAASIAAYFSQGRESGKLAVDYTMVKNVKKPAGALPGMVIYTEYRTLTAEADENLINKLKK